MAPLGFLPHLGHHHLIFTFTSFLHLHFSSLSESWIRPDVGPSGYFCYNQTYYIKHILSLTNIFFFLLTFVIKWVNTSFLFFILLSFCSQSLSGRLFNSPCHFAIISSQFYLTNSIADTSSDDFRQSFFITSHHLSRSPPRER